MKLPEDFSDIKFSLAFCAWLGMVIAFAIVIACVLITGKFLE